MLTPFVARIDICQVCEQEHRWGDDVRGMLSREFPEIEAEHGVPANHPYWTRWRELWDRFVQPVLYWGYDDAEGALCLKHLEPLLEQLRAMEPVAPC